MRVLVLTNLYPPHHVGGYELACHDVVERWAARGHDVCVLTSTTVIPGAPADPDGPGATPVRRSLWISLADGRIRVPEVPERWRNDRANQAALRDALRSFRPDVVSVWAMGAMSTGMLTTLHRSGVPLTYVVSDDWPTYAVKLDPWMRIFTRLGRLQRPAAPLLEALLGTPTHLPDLGRTGTFCFISETTRRRCGAVWRFPDATVTWSGIDLRTFPLVAPADAGTRPWRWRLLCVGRLDERKGIDDAIRALPHLPDEATLAVLAPVDDGYRTVLERLVAELGLGERVSFATSSRDGLRDRYREADAVLFPPTWPEPFGYVPLEAMACGTPVVATGAGGSGEFLLDGTTCVRCQPHDPASLAAAVTRLAGDPALRARLGRGGLAAAAELSVDTWAELLERWHVAAARRFADGRPPDRRLPLPA